MRRISQLLTVIFALGLLTAPIFAAPLFVSAGPTLHAPGAPTPVSPTLPWSLIGLGVGALGITIRKDVGAIAAKYVTRAGAASGDYKDGVSGAGSTWEANTGASEANYNAGVQAAISAHRFTHGVTGKAGKYQTNAVNLGSQRYGPGVANAKDAYARGMGPVISALGGLTLPPKSFRGSPNNQARANAVAVALSALRTTK